MWIIIILILFFYWLYWAIRMANFFKFIIVVGKMGSGKTTLLTKQALKYKKSKRLIWDDKIHKFRFVKLNIYSNSEIKGIDYNDFNPKELGITFKPKQYSVLFIDERSIFWSNRKFKSIPEETLTFMKQLRKHHCRIYLYSQSFNVDKVMRDLSQEMWLCKSFLITWSLSRRILKAPTIKESAIDAESQLVDNIKFAPIIIPGNMHLTWIPRWIKYFDSFQVHGESN